MAKTLTREAAAGDPTAAAPAEDPAATGREPERVQMRLTRDTWLTDPDGEVRKHTPDEGPVMVLRHEARALLAAGIASPTTL